MNLPTARENLNVLSQHTLPPPERLHQDVPLSQRASDTVRQARAALGRILQGQDPRLLVVVGPCSIHDIPSAMDYAERLKALADELSDQLLLVMRVYFEKPRT
ncbi:MAG: 3-deoxy-7-phosphoheptulonate synthase, partial [Burkholderiales bacterium]|nr:3-deoxy-7-phosphoheptulonate synthase [Burkholderiales bacterium]